MEKDYFKKNIEDFMSGATDFLTMQQTLPNGFMELTCYYILPGIFLVLNDIHAQTVPCNKGVMPENIFLINYCMNGRCEFRTDYDNYSYIDHNLISLSTQMAQDYFYYPSSAYKGYEIYMLPTMFQKETLDILEFFDIDWNHLLQMYAKGAVFHASEKMLSLWNSISENYGSANLGQLRLDIIELLKLLHDNPPIPSADMLFLSKTQAMLAKRAEELLVQDLSHHMSVKSVSEALGVSESSLKRYFRTVYGVNISTYMNEARMKYAAKLLSSSNTSISDIAKACGYVNQGRFASIFRAFYGMKPLDYRRQAKVCPEAESESKSEKIKQD